MTSPDYYKTLEIESGATQQQVKDAYKRAALKHHPDRVPSDSPERPARTKRFQQINDAYYTLSDPARRRDYDVTRSFSSSFGEDEGTGAGASAGASAGGWSSFFTGGAQAKAKTEEEFSNDQFGSVFEEMMHDEGLAEENAAPTGKFWSMIGGLSGGAMGFIIANFPGAVAGAVAGNRLGAVRDKRGMSVYSVFQELDQGDKARLLSNLAAKLFAHAVST